MRYLGFSTTRLLLLRSGVSPVNLVRRHEFCSHKVLELGHYAAQTLRELMAVYRDHEDLISVGAYRAGSNPLVDRAIQLQSEINRFLRQSVDEASSVSQAREALLALAARAEQLAGGAQPGGSLR